MIVDTADYRNPHYLLPSDRAGTLDYEFAADVVRTIAAVITASSVA